MIIAIPADDKNIESQVCISFGRAPFFLIYDTCDSSYSFLDNSAIASQGGAGIKAAQTIVDSGAGVLITPRCGENAAEVFHGAGVKIYKTNGNLLKENIELFSSDMLSELSEIHKGLHNHG